MNEFVRKFGENGLKLLNEQPWWQDVLAYRFSDVGGMSQPLFLAVRENYLSVYVEGQSLFEIRIDPRNPAAKLRVRIHHKFVDCKAQGQGHFAFDGRQAGGFDYKGPETLKEWVERAQTFVRNKRNIQAAEKQGVAAIIGRNLQTIDVEMALPSNRANDHPDDDSAPRMDIVALEDDGSALKIVFYEVKLLSNNASLRANNHVPPVLAQLKRYETWINSSGRAEQVARAYRNACDIFVKLNEMRWGKERITVHPFIAQAAKKDSKLCVDPKPRLIIFGCQPPKRQRSWEPHEKALRQNGIDGVRLIMKQVPEDVTLPDTTEVALATTRRDLESRIELALKRRPETSEGAVLAGQAPTEAPSVQSRRHSLPAKPRSNRFVGQLEDIEFLLPKHTTEPT